MYCDLQQVQSGSFSTVYKAWSSKLRKWVALKIIPKRKYSKEGFENEVKIMKMLGNKHPNICAMLDYFENEDNYVLVLEYLEFGDMYDFLGIAKQQGTSSYPALIQLDFHRIMRQLFSALAYAHSLGIAHRDVKPENILLTKEGDIKLTDWGHATTDTYSREYLIGTDKYRAPETFGGSGSYDTIMCDYWAAGITLLYLIFGKCPFKRATLPSGPELAAMHTHFETSNYEEFLKDNRGFIYKYFLAPVIYARRNEEYRYRGSSGGLVYVWKGLTSLHDIVRLCQIITDNLVTVNVADRSMRTTIMLAEEMWNKEARDSAVSASVVEPTTVNSNCNINYGNGLRRKEIVGKAI